MNYKTLSVISCCVLLSGCMNQDFSCQSSDVKTLVKKMYAIQIEEMSKPPEDYFRNNITRQVLGEDTQKIFDSLKAKSVETGNIAIEQIETLKTPDSDKKGEYLCKAVIATTWPAASAEKMRNHPVLNAKNIFDITYKDDRLQHPVFYKSKINQDDRIEIALQQPAPLLELLIRALLISDEEK